MHDGSLEHLADDALLETVRRLTARSNVGLAELLAHLGEVELRGIHRTRACASLYTYCLYELRMSEDAAFRRAKAARLVRRHPDVRDAIAKGELHLTGLLMIAPYLSGERHAEVLGRARFRSKRELLRLVAEIDPKPAVPSLVEPIGPSPAGRASYAAHVESMMGPVRELPFGGRPEDWIDEHAMETDEAHTGPEGPAWSEPRSNEERSGHDAPSAAARSANDARPLHYKVQFTASQRYVDLLEEALALLAREKPRPDLPDVQLRALELLVAKLRRERRGEASEAKATASERSADRPAPARVSPLARDEPRTDRPAPARRPPPSSGRKPERRYIPRSVRRAVWARDGARCVFVDDRGVRCRETACLELHHRHAHALGGPTTADNLELRCTAHNALAAEADFGREHLDRVRPSRLRTEA
ncbi:MAG TPA: HNH endonuclease signature motif containing protein [Polyangiaceae bacterium]